MEENKKSTSLIRRIFQEFKKLIRIFLVLLFSLIILSKLIDFLPYRLNKNYENEINQCKNKEEIFKVFEKFVLGISKEIKHEIRVKKSFDGNLELDKVKKKYIEEIDKISEKLAFNINFLDLSFDEKTKEWKKTNPLLLLLTKPKKFFVINPLSFLSLYLKRKIFVNNIKCTNEKFFFLDFIIKIIIIEIILIIGKKRIFQSRNVNDWEKDNKVSKNQFIDIIINLLSLLLLCDKTLLVANYPSFIEKINYLIWIFLINIVSILSFIIEELIVGNIESKQEIMKKIFQISLFSTFPPIILGFYLNNSTNRNYFIFVMQGIISNILKIFISFSKKEEKKEIF